MTSNVSGPEFQPPAAGDRLAAVGVMAVGGVEAPGPFGESGELSACLAEGLDVPVERGEVAFQKVDNVMAGGFAMAAKVEDGGDFGECEACGLGVSDEGEPIDGLVGVIAIVVGGAVGGGQHADLLVVADGLGGDQGASGELSDSHDSDLTPLTFQSAGRRTVVTWRR